MMILTAKNVSKWFGDDSSRTIAVKSAELDLGFGEMLYIVGPSGSGKTTLLSMISGILRPNEGEITIQGKNIWTLSDDDLCDLRLFSIGFVFQDFHLFPKLTSRENVAIPLILQKQPWDLAPYKLSLGEQQRVAIARAMITEPDILIFDEPTASLDGETGKKIISFIRNDVLNDKRGIIVVTHDNRIYDYATRMVHMEDGKITKIEGKYNGH